jgi:ATP-dependent DNA ligase
LPYPSNWIRARPEDQDPLHRTDAAAADRAPPDDPESWLYQLKLDGFRAIAFKTGNKVHLRSRNDKDFAAR